MPFGPGVFLLYRKGVETIIEHEPRRAEEIIDNGKAKKFISELKSAEK